MSERGQMALPASIRRRWGLDQGGVAAWVDLGDAVLVVPGGLSELRGQILAEADWDAAIGGFGDPELANQ